MDLQLHSDNVANSWRSMFTAIYIGNTISTGANDTTLSQQKSNIQQVELRLDKKFCIYKI